MKLVLLEKDPLFAQILQNSIEYTFPKMDVCVYSDLNLMDSLGAHDLFVYTAEQFPELTCFDTRTLRMHSQVAAPILLPDEIHALETMPAYRLINRKESMDSLTESVHEFVHAHYQAYEANRGFTVAVLPAAQDIERSLSALIRQRRFQADQLLLVPVMPAYFWPLITSEPTEVDSLSDLLLELSLTRDFDSLDLSPYVCLSHYHCYTLLPPRRSDDLVGASPELYRRFLMLIRHYLDSAAPEHWEALFVHYSSPLLLAQISLSQARYYYPYPDHPNDEGQKHFAIEIEQLAGALPANSEALEFPALELEPYHASYQRPPEALL